MNYNKALDNVNKAKKALKDFESLCQSNGLNFRFDKEYDGTNRFVGHNSSDFNKLHRTHLQNIKKAEQVVHELRPENVKILDFVSKSKEYKQRCQWGFLHNDCEHLNKLKKEILNKYAYCVDITTGPKPKCIHRDCGKVVKCNCRPGKKDPTKLVLSDELIGDDSPIRRYLIVRRDEMIIYINPNMGPEEIRRSVRENVRGTIGDYITSNSDHISNGFHEGRAMCSETLSNTMLPLNLGFAIAVSSSLNIPDELRKYASINLLRLGAATFGEYEDI